MVLMDQIIWAVSERHGGLGEHTAVLALTEQWQVSRDKTYSAGSVSQVDTKCHVKANINYDARNSKVGLRFADSQESKHALLPFTRLLAIPFWSNEQPTASTGNAKLNLHNQKL